MFCADSVLSSGVSLPIFASSLGYERGVSVGASVGDCMPLMDSPCSIGGDEMSVSMQSSMGDGGRAGAGQ